MAGFQRASALIQELGAELRDLRRIHAQYVAVWNFSGARQSASQCRKGQCGGLFLPAFTLPIQTLFPVSPLPMRTRLRDASVQRAMFRFGRHRESCFPNRSHSTDSPSHAREPSAAIQMTACASSPRAREPGAAIQTAACVFPPHAREPGAAIQMAACVSPSHARGNDSRPDCAMQK